MPTKPGIVEPPNLTLPAASLRSLLANLIDYAGLFPPAGLSMPNAVSKYADYLKGEYAWVLGRFVLPASRLSEFAQAQSAIQPSTRWRLSCLLGSEMDSDFSAIRQFNDRDDAVVDSIETKAETIEQVSRMMARVPESMQVYFEVPSGCPFELISAIQKRGARIKIRTGGLVPESIPPDHAVASALLKFASVRVAFKATAGLHHPLRCFKPLTYEPNAPAATMHGFLNVFLAAALAYQGTSAKVAAILDSDRADQLHFGDGEAQFAEVTIPTDQIRIMRERFAISFGSCSFEEPIEDLRALRLL